MLCHGERKFNFVGQVWWGRPCFHKLKIMQRMSTRQMVFSRVIFYINSCCPTIFVNGGNGESKIFFDASFSSFWPLKRYNLGRSRSLKSLQIMFKQCSTTRVLKSWIWIIKKIVLLSLRPWTNISGRHEQVYILPFTFRINCVQ